MGRGLLISIATACADLRTFPTRGSVTLSTQEKQESFEFPDEPKVAHRAEPPRQARQPKYHATSVCRYCGQRVKNRFMHVTPAGDDAWNWDEAATQHVPGCRWVLTKGGKIAPL